MFGVLMFHPHRQLFDHLAKSLQIYRFEDWYNIKHIDIKNAERKAWDIINFYYNGSKLKALSTVYPEYSWKVWRFHSTPDGYWVEFKNQKDFIDDCAKELSIQKWSDWYNVHLEDIRLFVEFNF